MRHRETYAQYLAPMTPFLMINIVSHAPFPLRINPHPYIKPTFVITYQRGTSTCLSEKSQLILGSSHGDPLNPFHNLTLDDFAITESEHKCLTELEQICNRHDLQISLLIKMKIEDNFIFPPLKRSLMLQDLEKQTEQSNIVYLQLFKDPANTIQCAPDFLSKLFQVGKQLQDLVVVDDGKTYDYLRELNHQHKPALDWLISFRGDWHICINYQHVLMKIFWHPALKNMTEKAGLQSKVIISLENCGNFQRTHNFLLQSFHAIL